MCVHTGALGQLGGTAATHGLADGSPLCRSLASNLPCMGTFQLLQGSISVSAGNISVIASHAYRHVYRHAYGQCVDAYMNMHMDVCIESWMDLCVDGCHGAAMCQQTTATCTCTWLGIDESGMALVSTRNVGGQVGASGCVGLVRSGA